MTGLYRSDLASVHHLGFGFHADECAPGILALLEPVLRAGGNVLELGCGSGALTRHLVAAGHRVVATDASPAMLELARSEVPGADEVRLLVLPDDPLPAADAVVSVGHVLSYLPGETAIDRALTAVADALRPGGVVALDLCDLRWGEARRAAPPYARVEDEWAIVTRFDLPSPDRFVRHITTFVRAGAGPGWRRDDERHSNVLLDTSEMPARLARLGVEATVAPAFGDEELPEGLVAVVGRRVGRPGLEPGPEA
jgi:SAM-dependent methyltransferase